MRQNAQIKCWAKSLSDAKNATSPFQSSVLTVIKSCDGGALTGQSEQIMSLVAAMLKLISTDLVHQNARQHSMLPCIGKLCVWEQGAIKAVPLQSQCTMVSHSTNIRWINDSISQS